MMAGRRTISMALSLSALDTWWLVGGLCLPAGLDPECWLETEISPWATRQPVLGRNRT